MLEVKNLTAIRDERILFESLSLRSMLANSFKSKDVMAQAKRPCYVLLRVLESVSGEILWQRSKIQSDRESYHQDLLF